MRSESKSDFLKVLAGGAVSGDDSACVGELLGSGADGRPNSSAVASAGGSAAGRSLDAPRTAVGQGVTVVRVDPQIALLRASGRLREAEAATAGESEGNTRWLEVI